MFLFNNSISFCNSVNCSGFLSMINACKCFDRSRITKRNNPKEIYIHNHLYHIKTYLSPL